MTKLQNPVVPDALELIEIDAAIFDLQTKFETNLSWLTNNYGRAYRHFRKDGEFQIYVPEIYIGKPNGKDPEYHRVTPDNDHKAMSCFVVGQGVPNNFQKNHFNYITHRVGVIFSVNLALINDPLLTTELFTQQLIRDVRAVLTRKLIGTFYTVKIVNEVREWREVFAEFSLNEENRSIMAPQQVFRINFDLTYQEACPDAPRNVCSILTQNISYAEILTCLLPLLDFSDDPTFDALTAQQNIDLSARYTGGTAVVNAVNTDNEILASGSFLSGGPYPLLIPNIEIIVNGESQGNKVVKSPLIINAPQIIYIRPKPDLNTTTYVDGDDGWYKINQPDTYVVPAFGIPALLDPTNPHKLMFPNAFGHLWRRTGIDGGYYDIDTAQYKLVDGTVSTQATVFGSGTTAYFIDHHTGLGYRWSLVGSGNTHAANFATAQAATYAGFSDWMICSYEEHAVLFTSWPNNNFQFPQDPNYYPIVWNSSFRFRSNSPGTPTTNFRAFSGGNYNPATGAGSNAWLPVRRHYT